MAYIKTFISVFKIIIIFVIIIKHFNTVSHIIRFKTLSLDFTDRITYLCQCILVRQILDLFFIFKNKKLNKPETTSLYL